MADRVAPARSARRCEHAPCTHPLARRVLLLLDLLDAVPVRLVALVVRRVVLGLGHRGVARAPASTLPAHFTPAVDSQVLKRCIARSKSTSQCPHKRALNAAQAQQLTRHSRGCTCQGRARSPRGVAHCTGRRLASSSPTLVTSPVLLQLQRRLAKYLGQLHPFCLTRLQWGPPQHQVVRSSYHGRPEEHRDREVVCSLDWPWLGRSQRGGSWRCSCRVPLPRRARLLSRAAR